MTIYNNDRQRIKSYLFIGAALIAGTAIAAELKSEPSLTTLDAPAEYLADNPTEAFTLEQANATDKARQLTWSRCLLGQSFTDGACEGKPTEFTSWQAAIDAAQLQAKDGWRLPNVKELMSITESTQVFPAINTSVFPFAKSLEFYSHEGTREEPDSSKWVPQEGSTGTECIENDWGWFDNGYGWSCVHPKIPATYKPQASSPYIWSSTPAAYYDNATAEHVYALDLSQGTPKEIKRNGDAIGGFQDLVEEKKALYVLLVKDMS